MPEVKPTEVESKASIKVVGVGGAGGSAVERMKEVGLSGVEFVAINTDAQALHHSPADVKVHIGRGLGAGGDPEKGREAAEEGREAIDKALDGADMVFITLGAGGGTGSGATLMLAKYCKQVLMIKNIHIFIITGFEDDVRGLKNTVDIFNELSEDYIVEAISNKKFLESGSMTRAEAEALANKEFSQKVSILLGNHIVPSDKNIDDRDLYKLTNTPGYMTVEYYGINKLKAPEDFDAMLFNCFLLFFININKAKATSIATKIRQELLMKSLLYIALFASRSIPG